MTARSDKRCKHCSNETEKQNGAAKFEDLPRSQSSAPAEKANCKKCQ
jgi:hypothetical protein